MSVCVCRVCLSSEPKKDISKLKYSENGKENSFDSIMLFCLGIQITKDSTLSKMCDECYLKIIQFYHFKSLALRNDAHLRFLSSQTIVIVENEDVKDESLKDAEHNRLHSHPSPTLSNNHSEDAYVDVTGEFNEEIESGDVNIKQKYIEYDVETSDSEEIAVKKYKRRKKVPRKGSILYQCTACDRQFLRKSLLSKHRLVTRRLKHKEEERNEHKIFMCHYCSKSYRSKEALQTHITLHTNERPYTCAECGKSWRSGPLLRAHLTTHRKERNYHCTLCAKSFKNKDNLAKHLRTHKKERKYPCSICSKKFYRLAHCRRHELTVHLCCYAKKRETDPLTKPKTMDGQT